MNEGLFSAYESRDEWKTLVERLGRAGCTSVYEISEGERPFLAAALRRKTGRPVVLLCSTELVAQRYAQDIERLTGKNAACCRREICSSAAPRPAGKARGCGCAIWTSFAGKTRAFCALVWKACWTAACRRRFSARA